MCRYRYRRRECIDLLSKMVLVCTVSTKGDTFSVDDRYVQFINMTYKELKFCKHRSLGYRRVWGSWWAKLSWSLVSLPWDLDGMVEQRLLANRPTRNFTYSLINSLENGRSGLWIFVTFAPLLLLLHCIDLLLLSLFFSFSLSAIPHPSVGLEDSCNYYNYCIAKNMKALS